jgi:hypothetical protein
MKTKAKAKSKNSNAGVRYDEDQIKSIVAFLRGHSNKETKGKFGCSAHYAGKLRAKFKVPGVTAVPAKKSVKSKKDLL